MLGYVYYKTHNIFAVMIIHALNNTYSTIMYYLFEGAGADEFSFCDFLGVPLVVVIMIAMFFASAMVMRRFSFMCPQPLFIEKKMVEEPCLENECLPSKSKDGQEQANDGCESNNVEI